MSEQVYRFDAALQAEVEGWIAHDPDPETAAELTALLQAARSGDAAAAAELGERFDGRLAFGTAGLRAELGGGPRRMNRVVVQQTTAGFAEFLGARDARGEIANKRVVIGFDARKNSDVFARDAAAIFAGYGFEALLLPGPLPTPITAFAVRQMEAAAGVMVTASHNPPNDNGYKVYLGDADGGSQIVPPADAEIASAISSAATKPLAAYPRDPDAVRTVSAEIFYEYMAATSRAVLRGERTGAAVQPKLVYTAMHGVGAATTASIFAAASLPQMVPVAAQNEPDPAFPTVSFPNPEEPGALDLAIAEARAVGADAIIAHDPDADRLAVALPARGARDEWQMLTGNQVGLLLGWRAARIVAEEAEASGSGIAAIDPRPALACTIVSSPALSAVAAHYGLAYQETLSGFKWVSRVPGLVFGFEEALGYLVDPTVVRDKDGISAAMAITEMICELHAQGKSLWDELDAATELFGHFASSQVTVRLESTGAVLQLAEKLRANPPQAFGEFAITKFTDLASNTDPNMRANVMRFDIGETARVMVRPSGTEPKLKLYIDARAATGTVSQRQQAATAMVAELEAAVREMLASL